MPKKGGKGKKGKGKKAEMETTGPAMEAFGVHLNDIVMTPLGVNATVLGVSSGALWLQFPGQIKAPLPPKATNKNEMESYGYVKRPQSAHIQRSIDERTRQLFQQRYYNGPGPKTAAMHLPWPKGPEQPLVVGDLRPKTAP